MCLSALSAAQLIRFSQRENVFMMLCAFVTHARGTKLFGTTLFPHLIGNYNSEISNLDSHHMAWVILGIQTQVSGLLLVYRFSAPFSELPKCGMFWGNDSGGGSSGPFRKHQHSTRPSKHVQMAGCGRARRTRHLSVEKLPTSRRSQV